MGLFEAAGRQGVLRLSATGPRLAVRAIAGILKEQARRVPAHLEPDVAGLPERADVAGGGFDLTSTVIEEERLCVLDSLLFGWRQLDSAALCGILSSLCYRSAFKAPYLFKPAECLIGPRIILRERLYDFPCSSLIARKSPVRVVFHRGISRHMLLPTTGEVPVI